ncbi:hypothetical protein D3C76_1511650 [compost metagenome]
MVAYGGGDGQLVRLQVPGHHPLPGAAQYQRTAPDLDLPQLLLHKTPVVGEHSLRRNAVVELGKLRCHSGLIPLGRILGYKLLLRDQTQIIGQKPGDP